MTCPYADISESELDDYADEIYDRLKHREYKVRVTKNTFMCPFCKDRENREYLFHDILQHARRVGKGSRRDSVKLKGKHIALAKFLDKYYSPREASTPSRKSTSHQNHDEHDNPREAAPSGKITSQRKQNESKVASTPSRKSPSQHNCDDKEKFASEHDNPREVTPSGTERKHNESGVASAPSSKSTSQHSRDDKEKFVWPWKGILANLPVEFKNGRYVGESGSKLRDELVKKGFNPLKVIPLWSAQGHSGFAIVNFSKDYIGFNNAISFEKDFELNHAGKRDWKATRSRGNKLYGWMAREDDYWSKDIVGKHLYDNGDVKTLADMKFEEERKNNSLVSNLTQTSLVKDQKREEMKSKLSEACVSLEKLALELDKMSQTHNEEMEAMRRRTVENKEKILNEHESFKHQLKSQKIELEKHEKLLEKREADYEQKIIKLRRQRKQNELATLEQKKSEQKVLKLVEEHERQKEALHKKIIDLEKQIDQRQALELQIEQLKGAAQVMEVMERDTETKKKMDEITEELKEKEEELGDLEALTQALVVKERKCNDELQDARKELIAGLRERKAVRANFGVKLMGLLDEKVIERVAKEKCSKEEQPTEAGELYTLCKQYIEDPEWHPFKVITEHGVSKEVINEEDERLKDLKSNFGEDVCGAVVTVMSELNEYNRSGRYPVPELWNFKDDRRATLGEGLEYLVNIWKLNRKKK